MGMNLDRIEPLKALGVELVSCNGDTAIFTIPLIGNRNDKGTFFAGSQYSAIVLAGWYLCSSWAKYHDLGEKVAVKSGDVAYPKAAVSDLTVAAHFVELPQKRPSGHWKAMINVVATDDQGDEVCVFLGDYRILQ
jgi:thioesterase domain-containing protein